jgi:hypothetical protein
MDEIRGAGKAESDLKFNDRREYEFGSPCGGRRILIRDRLRRLCGEGEW